MYPKKQIETLKTMDVQTGHPMMSQFNAFDKELGHKLKNPQGLVGEVIDNCSSLDEIAHLRATEIAMWMLDHPDEDVIAQGVNLMSWVDQRYESPLARVCVAMAKLDGHYCQVDEDGGFQLLESVLKMEDCDGNRRGLALIWLARCYSKGQGVAVNLSKAGKLFAEAALGGHGVAHHQAGEFFSGRLVPDDSAMAQHLDFERAAQYYEKAIAAGVEEAQVSLGLLHIDKKLKASDLAHGLKLLRMAAHDGQAEAIAALRIH